MPRLHCRCLQHRILLGSILLLLLAADPAPADVDVLPSWNDTAPRQALIDFVTRVTTEGSDDFVPVAERIAVFDNDGTLWPEDPVPFQLAYVLDTLKQMAADKPELREDPMVQAALSGDFGKLLEGPHHDGLMHVMALTHSGMTTDEFDASVEEWITTARHPRFDRRYDQLTYQPMQEVLSYLRAHGFKTFIVSGGGADFMRVWSERVYGIPPQQVVGSTARTTYELRDSRPVLIKTMDHLFVDDKEGKPVGLRRPPEQQREARGGVGGRGTARLDGRRHASRLEIGFCGKGVAGTLWMPTTTARGDTNTNFSS